MPRLHSLGVRESGDHLCHSSNAGICGALAQACWLAVVSSATDILIASVLSIEGIADDAFAGLGSSLARLPPRPSSPSFWIL